MLPVTLTIQGLYAYKTRQTIDFRALTPHHLFGVFGAVGSGKSSILDAITLALYNEVERLDRGDRRNHNLFNRQSDVFLIDFQFETGAENSLYRFTVQNSRTKKGEPKTFERSAYQWESGNWMPLPDTDASKILNLSYDNFKRTIIIPQGRFQEFLQLGGKDRTEMLKELFPKVAEFDLQGKTGAKQKATELEMEQLKGKLSEIGNKEEPDPEVWETRIAEAREILAHREKERDEAEAAFTRIEELRSLTKDLETAQGTLARCRELEAEKKNQKEALERYELIFKDFYSDIKLFDQSTAAVQQAHAELAKTELAREKIQKQTDEARRILEAAKAQSANLPEWENEKTDWAIALQLWSLWQKNTAAEGHKNRAEAEFTRIGMQKSEIAARLAQLKGEKEQADLGAEKLADVLAADQFFKDADRLRAELEACTQKLAELAVSLSEIKKNKDKALTTNLLPHLPGVTAESKIQQVLEATAVFKSKTTTDIEALQQTKNDLLEKNQLFRFANQMADGEPCPLCGSIHHPSVISAQDVTRLQAENEQGIKEANGLLETATGVEVALAALQSEQKMHVHAQKEWAAKQVEIERQLKNLEDKTADNPFVSRGKEGVATQLAELRGQVGKTTQLREALKKLEEEIAGEEVRIEQLRNEKEAAVQELTATGSQISLLKSQLKKPESVFWDSETETPIHKKAEEIQQRIQSVQEHLTQAQSVFESLEKEHHSLSATATTQMQTLGEQRNRVREQELTLSKKVEVSSFESLESIRTVLSQNLDTVHIRRELDLFFAELLKAVERVKSLEERSQNQHFDPDKWEQAKLKTEEAKAALQLAQGNLSVLLSNLELLRQDLAKQATLRQELQALEVRYQNLTLLFNLFKGQAFVNYASGIYLKNIVEQANQRFFRLTRQRLRLVLDGDNNFYVQDFLNGGHERLAKTLSGGQTFQASLSLALALADNVRHLTQSKRNFFFLDEGFGALDRESLTLVVETLRQLRYEDRIVGIISHVEELQQEIDHSLRIRLDDEKGSIIETGD